MAEHDTCPCAAVAALQQIVERHEEMIAKHGEAIEKHQTRLYEGNTAFELIHRDIETLTAAVNNNNARMKEILDKPAKRWDTIVSQVIGLIVAAAVGYLLHGGVF